MNVRLKKEENDHFRDWIIKEWKHHNTVDPFYKLKIISPNDLTFEENEEYYKIIFNENEVGFIGLKIYESSIYLYRFYIEEEYRGKGLGTDALKQVIKKAVEENKDLSLEVYGSNEAKRLYEKLGFQDRYTNMVLKVNDKIEMQP